MKLTGRLLFLSFVFGLFTGCSSSSESEASKSNTDVPSTIMTTSTTSTTTTSTTTTTRPPGDPQLTFDVAVAFSGAKDWSKISDSSCGKFALQVFEDHISFFQFDGYDWVDKSELLGSDGPDTPLTVTSRDLNGDGVIEYLVKYRTPEYTYGSVFMQFNCVWEWANFVDGDSGYAQVIGLTYNDDKAVLGGVTTNSSGYPNPFTATFNSSLEVFEIFLSTFNPPPPKCVSAFDTVRRADISEFVYSWLGTTNDYLPRGSWYRLATPVQKTLQNCRKDDWIIEANSRRSSFDNHTDAQYQSESYVLLENENAGDVLNQLCSQYLYWNNEPEYAFRTSLSIACD